MKVENSLIREEGFLKNNDKILATWGCIFFSSNILGLCKLQIKHLHHYCNASCRNKQNLTEFKRSLKLLKDLGYIDFDETALEDLAQDSELDIKGNGEKFDSIKAKYTELNFKEFEIIGNLKFKSTKIQNNDILNVFTYIKSYAGNGFTNVSIDKMKFETGIGEVKLNKCIDLLEGTLIKKVNVNCNSENNCGCVGKTSNLLVLVNDKTEENIKNGLQYLSDKGLVVTAKGDKEDTSTTVDSEVTAEPDDTTQAEGQTEKTTEETIKKESNAEDDDNDLLPWETTEKATKSYFVHQPPKCTYNPFL